MMTYVGGGQHKWRHSIPILLPFLTQNLSLFITSVHRKAPLQHTMWAAVKEVATQWGYDEEGFAVFASELLVGYWKSIGLMNIFHEYSHRDAEDDEAWGFRCIYFCYSIFVCTIYCLFGSRRTYEVALFVLAIVVNSWRFLVVYMSNTLTIQYALKNGAVTIFKRLHGEKEKLRAYRALFRERASTETCLM
jgi:hypothetical protein